MRAIRSSVSLRTLGSAPAPTAHARAVDGHPATTRELATVAAFLAVIGSVALAIFYSRGEILLSGDAVAHINIARRVFDSRTPGPLQLGSVWLPLPHLLTLPFVVSDRMWSSGIGGSIVSVLSFAIAGCGLFRLVKGWSRIAAWLAVIIFAANPNLLFVQSTALNEPLYLAAFVWAVVFFREAHRELQAAQLFAAGKSVSYGAIALFAASLTRYDGWFLSCVCWAAIAPVVLSSGAIAQSGDVAARSLFRRALLLTALGPILWVAYNLGTYKNPLEFANGPYSAKAIAQRSTQKGNPPYPGEHKPATAAIFFIKAAQLNMGEGFAAKLLCTIAAICAALFAFRKEWLPIVPLWSPAVFYAFSVAHGAVPIFLPVWWPFSYYNVRYGLELLPAFAVSAPLAVVLLSERASSRVKLSVLTVIVFIVGVSYVTAWRAAPVSLREVRVNGRARLELDRKLAQRLSALPRGSTVLTYTGSHSGAFEIAGFPLRRTINEGVLPSWQPALANPAAAADYVITADDDPVAEGVSRHPAGLVAVDVLAVPGQPRTVIYKSLHPTKKPGTL